MTKVIQTWRWPIRTLGIIGLSAIYLLVQWGCATQPPGLPEEVRAQLGTIGIVSAQWTPESDFEGPGIGLQGRIGGAWAGLKSGATDGAKGGALIGAYVLKYTQEYHGGWHPGALILALVSSVVGATVGTIAGGLGGMTKGMIDPMDNPDLKDPAILEPVLAEYLKKLRMQEEFQKEVARVARQTTRHQIIELAKEGPTQRGNTISYLKLKEKNLDSVLEVSVLSLGLKSISSTSPIFSVFLVGRADLRRVEDDALLYRVTLTHTSPSLSLEKWMVNHALPFRMALDKAYRNLAEQVVSTLL